MFALYILHFISPSTSLLVAIIYEDFEYTTSQCIQSSTTPCLAIGTCSTRLIEILMMARSVWLVLSQFVTQLFSINIWVFNCHMYQYSPISLVRRALVLNNNSPNQITWRCGQGRPFSREKFPKWKISTKKSEFRRFPSPKISDDLFQ